MKQFIVDRHTTPSTPSMDEVPNEKIPIYDNLADAEADLANLEEGQIVATPDTGDELSQPVDEVESGNLHAVTSNAVAGACPRYPNYAKGNIWTDSATSFTTTCDCYLMYLAVGRTAGNRTLYIDDNKVGVEDNSGDIYISTFYGFVKKGSTIRRGDNYSIVGGSYLRLFELI